MPDDERFTEKRSLLERAVLEPPTASKKPPRLEDGQEVRPMGIIGDRDLVLVFRAVGVVPFPVSSEEEARAALKKVLEGSFGVLFVSVNWTGLLSEEIDKINGFPIVVEVPDMKGSRSGSEDFISRIIERAVGVDITKKTGE